MKFKYFEALVEESVRCDVEEIATRRFFRAVFGSYESYAEALSDVESDSVYGTEQYDDERYNAFEERHELGSCYKERLNAAYTPEELTQIIEELFSDECFNATWKKSILLSKIQELGFEPDIYYAERGKLVENISPQDECDECFDSFGEQSDEQPSEDEYWADIRRRSADKENQSMAALCLNYVLCLENNDASEQYDAMRIASQALMLAVCMGDEKAIREHIERYYLHAMRDLTAAIDNKEIEHRYKAFHRLGCAKTADAFLTQGVELLEAEAIKPETTENQTYLLYQALAVIAGCIGDMQKVNNYKEMQMEFLGLGFRYDQ